MISDMDNLKIVSVYSGNAMKNSKVLKRKHSAFILRTSGKRFFDFGDKTLTVSKGEIFFLPKSATYNSKNVSEEECGYICIAFDSDDTGSTPEVYSLESFPEAYHIFNHLVYNWDSSGKAGKFKCLSMFYSLLSYISSTETPRLFPQKQIRTYKTGNLVS